MGTANSLLAAVPSPTSSAFLRWVKSHAAYRIGECPFARTTTYYFAQAGSDSTGDGSQARPFQTLAKASALIAASSGNIACLLNRGDVWREATPLAIAKASVTLGSYGSGNKPVITYFTRQYTSAWTATGSGSYYHAEATEIAWVREVGDEFTPYTMATSVLNCDATARSWWWDTGTSRLYVNAGGGRNPNTLSLEAVPHQTVDAIFVDDVDGVRIDSIVLHGGGIMSRANSTQHTYGFKTGAAGTNATVFADCECYYSGYHAFGQSSLNGGICTFVNCKSGFCRGADDGGFDFIVYSQDGGNECLVISCTALYGPLPGTPGGAIYGHTVGDGTAKHGLILESGLTVPAGTYAHSGARGYSDLPSAGGVITAVRCFILGRHVGTSAAPLAVASASVVMCHEDVYHANSAQFVNCSTNSGPDTISGGTLGNGWCVNCTLIINCTGYNPKVTSNQSGKRQRFWHCYVSMRDYASVDYSGFESASTGFGASAVDVEVHQSIFEGINGTIVPGINNNLLSDQSTPISPPQQTGNAYVGISEPGYLAAFMFSSNDPRKLTLTGTPTVPTVPNASYLVAAGLAIVDYDAGGLTRRPGQIVAGPRAGIYANVAGASALDLVNAADLALGKGL